MSAYGGSAGFLGCCFLQFAFLKFDSVSDLKKKKE
jgi:hypothetical protein